MSLQTSTVASQRRLDTLQASAVAGLDLRQISLDLADIKCDRAAVL